MTQMTLNSVIACAMVASSYAIAYTWRVVKTDEPVISETTSVTSEATPSETGSQASQTSECVSPAEKHMASGSETASQASESTQTSECVSPAEKHMALLERVNDDLQEANSNWASYAEELSYKNRQLELELASSKTMVRTTIIVGFILFISYAALIYAAILVSGAA